MGAVGGITFNVFSGYATCKAISLKLQVFKANVIKLMKGNTIQIGSLFLRFVNLLKLFFFKGWGISISSLCRGL